MDKQNLYVLFLIDDMDIYYDCSDPECIHYKPCMMLKYQHPDLATTHSIEQELSYMDLIKFFQRLQH